MAFLPYKWVDMVSALATPQRRHTLDASVFEEFSLGGFDPNFPAGLRLQWLGTAGFRFDYEGHTLVLDPYFTRPSMGDVFGRKDLHTNEALIAPVLDRCDAIVVGHTHFDHALDVPAIAKHFGCKVYGSTSLQNLMQRHGLAQQSVVAEHGHVYTVGPFEITMIHSVHSKLIAGLAVPHDGEITCDHMDHMGSGHYKCGQTYGIHIAVGGATFYHQGSANLIDENIRHHSIDYFLSGIAGRGFTWRYMDRILGKLQPRVIIPHHYDNFFLPLDGPMGFSFNVNMHKFVDEVRAVSNDFTIRTLPILGTLERG